MGIAKTILNWLAKIAIWASKLPKTRQKRASGQSFLDASIPRRLCMRDWFEIRLGIWGNGGSRRNKS